MNNSYEDFDDTPIRSSYGYRAEHEQHTIQFNNSVMSSLIERQRDAFNEAGVSEDVLERVKLIWTNNLKEEQSRNIQQAHEQTIKQSQEKAIENRAQIDQLTRMNHQQNYVTGPVGMHYPHHVAYVPNREYQSLQQQQYQAQGEFQHHRPGQTFQTQGTGPGVAYHGQSKPARPQPFQPSYRPYNVGSPASNMRRSPSILSNVGTSQRPQQTTLGKRSYSGASFQNTPAAATLGLYTPSTSNKRQNKGNNDGNSDEEESDDSGLFEEPEEIVEKKEESKNDGISEITPLEESEVKASPVQQPPSISDPPSEEQSDSDTENFEQDEAKIKDMLLGEYVKVTRTKVKYKCDFRNVIACVRGRDYVVRTLAADFDY